MHSPIDLRSDTVTRPTPEMQEAMAKAELGDDVLGDDPTVLLLEQMAANLMGKEAALFVPSGTMGNNIAIKVHTRPGDEILTDWDAHSIFYECGGPAVLAGVQTRQFRSRKGIPDLVEIADSIHSESLHTPGTALLVLENTHNRHGAAVIPLDVMTSIRELCVSRGVRVHLDGARIFNAAVALQIPAKELAAQVDSITFCLSKGLGCPVGSVLCGTREFVDRARRVRKLFGGGMRQAGVLAACGVIALRSMIERLADDHKNARTLWDGLRELPGIQVDEAPATNMVYINTEKPAQELMERLADQRVLCLDMAPHRIRLVTHKDVDAEDIEAALIAFRTAVR